MALRSGYYGLKKKLLEKVNALPGIKSIGDGLTLNSTGVLSATGGGGGGTTVIANPEGTATDDLNKLQVGTTIYEISGAGELTELSDVNISSPQDGQILQYDSTSSKWVNVINNPIPEGSTIAPTDDIQTWLHCAGIYNKDYTTISHVLADSTTLLALISSNNAVDYMVRSTTWATNVCANSTAMTDIGSNNYCADTLLADSTWRTAICDSTYFESVLNVKVPTMTSNTTPSGEVSCSALYDEAYQPYIAFDGSDEDFTSVLGDNSVWYIAYQFTSNVKVNAFKYRANTNASALNYLLGFTLYIDGSNDGTNWTSLYNKALTADEHKACVNTPLFEDISNGNKYRYYRIRSNAANYGYNSLFSLTSLQFYGRA